MKIDKDKLAKLQGLNPCTSDVTFVPPVYAELALEEDMEDYIPNFTCKMMTNKHVELVKRIFVDYGKGEFYDRKERILEVLKSVLVGWNNVYELTTGEEVEFSTENMESLTENVLDSILMEASKYAGFVPR